MASTLGLVGQWLASGLVLFGMAIATTAPAADRTTIPLEDPAGGAAFTLAEAKGQVVALHFLIEDDCPFCGKTAMEYSTRGTLLPGVRQVFVRNASAEKILAYAKEAGPRMPKVYRDKDGALSEAFEIPGGYAFHGMTVRYPALVILDQSGKETFRYVGKENTDRLAFDKFEAEARKLLPEAKVKEYNLDDGVGLKGYDPVSYFESSKPTKGKETISTTYRGVRYQFVSNETRDKFIASPEKFLPTYGGWCATAMAEGDKVDYDPQNYIVSNGRLFLFYKGFLGNAKTKWEKGDPAKLEKNADASWEKIAGEKAPTKN